MTDPLDGHVSGEATIEGIDAASIITSAKPLYDLSTYTHGLDPSTKGGRKLCQSGVAPLVASARGYRVLNSNSPTPGAPPRPVKDEVREIAATVGLTDARTEAYKSILAAVADGPALWMPWYDYDAVAGRSIAEREGATFTEPLACRTPQIRPDNPRVDSEGKPLGKYLSLKGQRLPVDIHPATPASWLSGDAAATTVMIAEGLIKGDSALTAMLRETLGNSAAANIESSLATAHLPGTDPRARLSALMEQVPVDERVLILSVSSVTTWMAGSVWDGFSWKDKTLWLAFDADVHSNRQVYNMTRRLTDLATKRGATVHLVDLADLGGDPKAKEGLDDLLGELQRCSWADIPNALGDVPDTPPSSADEVLGYEEFGRTMYVVTDDGCRIEEVHDDGNNLPVCPIVGRLSATIVPRKPIDLEIETGVLLTYDQLDAMGAREEGTGNKVPRGAAEIRWRDAETGYPRVVTVTGPLTALRGNPALWGDEKRAGSMYVPPALNNKSYGYWPPTGPMAQVFTKVLGRYRSEEHVEIPEWGVSGWVPTADADGGMAYVVGGLAVDRHGLIEATNLHYSDGVQDEKKRAQLANMTMEGRQRLLVNHPAMPKIGTKYGVIEPDGVRPDENGKVTVDWREQARKDARTVCRAMFMSGVWTNPAFAATAFAVAIEPALMPMIRLRTAVYMVGGAGTGKSYTASIMQSFWQKRAGAWGIGDAVGFPGAVPNGGRFADGDTTAATEVALHTAHYWTLDDGASGESEQAGQDTRQYMAALIRRVFNGSSRGRSNTSLGIEAAFEPRASLVITAENDMTVSSARDRCIRMMFGGEEGRGSLGSDLNAVATLRDSDPAPARLMYAFLRWLACEMSTKGYETVAAKVRTIKQSLSKRAADWLRQTVGLNGVPARHGGIASGPLTALNIFAMFLEDLGILHEPDFAWFNTQSTTLRVKESVTDSGVTIPEYGAMLIEEYFMRQIGESFEQRFSTSFGSRTLLGIRRAAREASIYFRVPGQPDMAPGDYLGNPELNDLLGWPQGERSSHAKLVGEVYKGRDGKPDAIMVNPEAFSTIKAAARDEIATTEDSAWSQLFAEGFVATQDKGGWSRHAKRNYCRVTLVRGGPVEQRIPIPLPYFLGYDHPMMTQAEREATQVAARGDTDRAARMIEAEDAADSDEMF